MRGSNHKTSANWQRNGDLNIDLVLSEKFCQNDERLSQFNFLHRIAHVEENEGGRTMNRREFISGPAATGLVAAAVASLPLDAIALTSPIFRPGETGRVMCSEDGGVSWRVVMDFGRDFRVLEVHQHAKHISCQVANGPHGFMLYSRDGRRWATSPRAIPKSRLTRRLDFGPRSQHNRSTARV